MITWDLIWGIARYGGFAIIGGWLTYITMVEERTSDAYEAGFTTGQVYADPTVKTRRANV